MIYKVGFFLVFVSSCATAMNNDFSMALHMRYMERRGECMILLNGMVLDYVTGTVLGKIEDGRFIAKSETELNPSILARWNAKALNENDSQTQ